MKLTIFNGKLAQKIFIFFIAASFLPLLIGSFISYIHVRDVIRSDITYNLQSTSKEYGLSLFFRLKLAKDTLTSNAQDLISEKNLLHTQNNISNYFTAISVNNANGNKKALWGEIDSAVYNTKLDNNSHLISIKKSDNKHDIYIALKNGIYGKINSKFLWDIKSISQDVDLCVTTKLQERLFCDAPVSEEQLQQTGKKYQSRKSRLLIWDNSKTDILSTYWPLFMDHEFNIDDWIIVAFQSEGIFKSRLSSYKKLFFPLILFSLLFVTFLSSIIIRKNLTAINKLIDGTRRIRDNNFNEPIKIKTNDEFQELATSFNTMAKGVKSVTNEYNAFLEVDKLILASENPKKIIRSIFHSLDTIVNFDDLLFINQSKDVKSLDKFYTQKKSYRSLKSSNENLLEKHSLQLIKTEKTTIIPLNKLSSIKENKLWSLEGSFACIIPITYENKNYSFIVGTFKENNIDNLIETKIKNFSSRISVAFQALNRESALTTQANYDTLTKIPNRTKITKLYSQQLAYIKSEGIFSALLFLDLDHFKHVNDNYGHITGDKLLQDFSQRIQSTLDKTDVIARLGGDEFVVAITAEDKESLINNIDNLCKKIISEAGKPFDIGNHTVHIGASIGVSISPGHADTFEDSLRFSDVAMYFSKKNGGNCYTLYDPEMSENLLKKTLLERDLRIALENREVNVHFQPKVSATSRELVGFEALFRWTHNTYGVISPFVAIEMAEDIGAIDILGKLVFELSLEQYSEWISKEYEVGIIAINVSPSQLIQTGFIDFIKSTIDRFPEIRPEMIELEITESVMLQGKQTSLKILHQIRELGCRIAIDDFGTGYSSLSYLLDIPANTLKIDRAFVIKIEQDENALSLLSSLITFGKSMGYKIVAEGVETEQQAKFLTDCHADQLQGYLFSKPLPAELVESRFFKTQNKKRSY